MLRVLEETEIRPPPGSVPATTLPCTYFDLIFLGITPLQTLYFYQSPQPLTILPNLKHSLSLALKHYYPLAGNLRWPQQSTKPEIVYKDGDSVFLTVAECDTLDFDKLCDPSPQDCGSFAPLYARYRDVTLSGEALVPLAAIQITFFPGKGVCIGIAMRHVVADAKTTFSFMKAWGSMYTSSINELPLPSYDRSAILNGFEKKETTLLKLLKESNQGKEAFHTMINSKGVTPKGMSQIAVKMSRNHIERLKHWVSASIKKKDTDNLIEQPVHVSSFTVTCAYIWVCFIKTRCSHRGEQCSDKEATEHFFFPVDIRTHLDSPVPATYFGNCGLSLEVRAKRGELLGDLGIPIAAKLIGRAIQNLDVHRELAKDLYAHASLPLEQIVGTAGFPRLGVYETNFGWGKPKSVRVNTFEDDGIVCMFCNDSPDEEGGIEIGLIWNADEVQGFASAFANSLGSYGLLMSKH